MGCNSSSVADSATSPKKAGDAGITQKSKSVCEAPTTIDKNQTTSGPTELRGPTELQSSNLNSTEIPMGPSKHDENTQPVATEGEGMGDDATANSMILPGAALPIQANALQTAEAASSPLRSTASPQADKRLEPSRGYPPGYKASAFPPRASRISDDSPISQISDLSGITVNSSPRAGSRRPAVLPPLPKGSVGMLPLDSDADADVDREVKKDVHMPLPGKSGLKLELPGTAALTASTARPMSALSRQGNGLGCLDEDVCDGGDEVEDETNKVLMAEVGNYVTDMEKMLLNAGMPFGVDDEQLMTDILNDTRQPAGIGAQGDTRVLTTVV
eukprot:TRINITY_DN58431_c0_g1_i1.p1 TRINITY_DN58431_c0_g1~~TRINITY_DN58431_c0_g1_i1.p1  ORF type:complete len:330 (+),score=54.02 TRINITY_DN58431_c0_g1_i1:65-1054(+)